MSWSIAYIGTPKKISEALQNHSTKLEGNSKIEFDAALPHLQALVQLNQNTAQDPIFKLTAAGHAYTGYSSCNVNIEPLPATLV